MESNDALANSIFSVCQEHILVDINRDSMIKFPDIASAISHFHLEPIPK